MCTQNEPWSLGVMIEYYIYLFNLLYLFSDFGDMGAAAKSYTSNDKKKKGFSFNRFHLRFFHKGGFPDNES